MEPGENLGVGESGPVVDAPGPLSGWWPSEREFEQTLTERQADTKLDAVTLTDRFLLQHRLDDGRTVVEHFVGAHPELPEDDRAMVLAWQDVVEGIFEIEQRDGGSARHDQPVR